MTKEKLLECKNNELNNEIIRLRKEISMLKCENSFLKEKLIEVFMYPKEINNIRHQF